MVSNDALNVTESSRFLRCLHLPGALADRWDCGMADTARRSNTSPEFRARDDTFPFVILAWARRLPRPICVAGCPRRSGGICKAPDPSSGRTKSEISRQQSG